MPEFDSFDDWYRSSAPRLVASVGLAVGDLELAKDAVADACVLALERWSRVRMMEQPSGWVYRVAVNKVRRRARRDATERFLLRRAGPTQIEPSAEWDPVLWKAVAALPDRQREALVLRYVMDFTQAEIARSMGIAAGTVAATLSQARSRLASALGTVDDSIGFPDD